MLADDLLALTQALGVEQFSVCGVSLGGMVALQSALQAPGRISRAVVCSTARRIAPPPNGWDGRQRAALEGGMAPLADGMVARMFSAAWRASHAPAVASLRSVFERTDPAGYAGACAVLRDADVGSGLARVIAPTLVVSGEDDPLCPPAAARQLANGLAKARHLLLPGGHFPPLEAACEFAEAVVAHIGAPDSHDGGS